MLEEKGSILESKKWITPQVTVLTRSKNEESVLVVCKTSTTAAGLYQYDINCTHDQDCAECNEFVSS